MLCLGGLGFGYIVWWDEPWPSDQIDLKRRSRCDVEKCCNTLHEGEEQSPREEAGWPACEAGQPQMLSSGPPLHSGVLWCCWHFLASLKLGCHPQHGARNVVFNKCKCSSKNKYEIRKRTDNTDVAF
jgi:hypothetical protein